MPHFMDIPEALEFIAGQSWLSPDEPVRALGGGGRTALAFRPTKLTWRAAIREIAAILRRVL